jgi:uncharacterized membrane protein
VGFANGGIPPYSYEIAFSPDSIPKVDPKKSNNGLISANVAVPADVEKASYVIKVSDNSGRKTTYDSAKSGEEILLKKSK